MHTNLAPHIYRKRVIIEGKYTISITSLDTVYNFLLRLSQQVKDKEGILKGVRGPFVSNYNFSEEVTQNSSFEGSIIWNEHEARLYVWGDAKFFTLDIYTCSPFETDTIIDFVTREFGSEDISWHELPQPSPFEESNLLELRSGEGVLGVGVFAKEDISKNTFLTYVDGEIIFSKTESELAHVRKTTVNHCVAFSKYFYRNAFNSIAVKINHSCQPNAYLKDLFCVYSMDDIKKGDQVTVSYSLFTNSDWKVPGGRCLCKSPNCYGDIVPWRNLTKEDKVKYLPFTSDWIVYEEMKERGYIEKLKDSI
ncbi:MAG: SET domain-containing protein-lysine N-methyltransferase [Candidatus Pacebacteria bacterium]|nr:SET domain-containing protein-lysine N-methyltransferase [Candidatus Paceibacterota bacterium]